MTNKYLLDAPLGKVSEYICEYTPSLLFPIPREGKREEISVFYPLPFKGVDIWNAFEISCLDSKGKPQVYVATFIVPCESPCIFESKSLKLYLNSFNQSKFSNKDVLQESIQRDLSAVAQAPVQVTVWPLQKANWIMAQKMDGSNIDDLDLEISEYTVNPELLISGSEIVEETLCSDLLKSNCLATGQPDWASISIRYKGPKICQYSLLKYLISYRQHSEFHEHCVERIFMDIKEHCRVEQLSVYARYTRRGGIDLNPFRSTETIYPSNNRHFRQ